MPLLFFMHSVNQVVFLLSGITAVATGVHSAENPYIVIIIETFKKSVLENREERRDMDILGNTSAEEFCALENRK